MAAPLPSRWFVLGRLVLATIRDRTQRDEIEGDLVELWHRRAAAGRRDLRRAYVRDLVGLLLIAIARIVRRFRGGVAAVWSGGFAMWQDVRYAVRLMLRRPAQAVAAVATLAIGIGAALAIFTAVDRLLLRPLPFPDPDRLVHVERAPLRLGARTGGMLDRAFLDLPVIAAAGLWAPGGLNLEQGAHGVRLAAAAVDDGFFRVMGIAPLLGSPLPVPDGASRYAVLGFHAWQNRFGADRGIIGQSIILNGHGYVVTGVMPPGFSFPGRTDVWVPPMVDLQVTGSAFAPEVVARLAGGVTLEQARAVIAGYEEARASRRNRDAGPADDDGIGITPLGGELTNGARPTLLLLGASAGLLLLVVCASIANLLLAGVAARDQELTVRRALGASRWRLGRQLLIESLLLALAGSAAGVLIAAWALQSLRALTPTTLDPGMLNALDARFAVTAIGLTILTTLIFGVAPGIAAAARQAAHVVRIGHSDVRSPGSRRLRSGLIVAQMALALILLMASAGAVRALIQQTRIDPGFRGGTAVAMTVTLPLDRFRQPSTVTGFFERAHERLLAVPGVRRVAATGYLPGSNEIGVGLELAIPGRIRSPEAPRLYASYLSSSPDYFTVMGIRVVEGRPFTPADRAGSPPVVVLSETAARGLFPDGTSAVGQQVSLRIGRDPVVYEIVGVVADVHLRSLTTNARALRQAYVPLLQNPPYGNLSFVAEVEGDPTHAIPALTSAMPDVDRSVPVYDARPVESIVDSYYAAHRLSGTLVSGFAIITLLVAAIGLYGLMTQLVTERVREIGIRLALGADPSVVRRGVVRHGATHAVLGALIGALGASASLKLFGAMLPGLEAPGTGTFAINTAVLLLAALAAAWIPSARATRVDPVAALRQ